MIPEDRRSRAGYEATRRRSILGQTCVRHCDVAHSRCTAQFLGCCTALAGRCAATVPRAMSKVRLDTLLADRGLFASRARAAASVMAGEVRLGAQGERARRSPGQMVADDVAVASTSARATSRAAASSSRTRSTPSALDVGGRRCLDVGASTGGFTDCLLQRGAAHVIALDVAYGELDWSLRSDDARHGARAHQRPRADGPSSCRTRPDLVVDRRLVHLADARCSRAVLGLLRRALRRAGDGQAAVRGRARARRQGRRRARPRAARARRCAGRRVRARRAAARAVLGFAPSGLPGPKGNLETFV